MLLYVSLIFNAIFLGLIVLGTFVIHRAGKTILEYESFYDQTLKELQHHLIYLQRLMSSNMTISADDDVVRVFKAIKDFYEMFHGYVEARKAQKYDS